MKKNPSVLIALLLVVSMLTFLFSGCSGCTQAGSDSETTVGTEASTLMPGYIDDTGAEEESKENTDDNTSAQKETESSLTGNTPIKGGTVQSGAESDAPAQAGTDSAEVTTSPADGVTQTATEKSAPAITETVTEITTEATVVTSTEDATEEQTDATEAPVTLPTDDAAEATEATATEPEFTLPELPDSDIIGPKPPINPDDLIPPQFTTAVPTETSEADSGDITLPTLPSSDIIGPQPPVEIPTATAPTETATAPVDYSGRLEFTYYGRYSGKFIEDGTDEYVQNVAILLVTNISDEYLEYAVVTFDISGTAAAFTATGIAPGESAWVLEQNRLQIDTDAVFTHVDDIASFTDYVSPDTKDVSVHLGEGQLTVKNNTGKKLNGVYVYYKQVHTDGNFLGGITYRVSVGDLEKDEEATSIALHCTAKNCRIVAIDWEEEG